MEQAGVQLIAAGGDVYISTINNATKATNTFVDTTDKASGRVSAAGQVMIGGLRKVGEVAVDVFGKALKATAAFVGDSVDVAGDFEAGMKRFQAVAGAGVDTKGLEKFKDLFISLGKELPVSTSEVEQAAIEMVSGGIDPAIVAGGALRQTIQFAAAANLSLADAAATSAKFLAGWTSSAATTEEKVAFLALSTDTLTKAAAASSTTAAELRLGLFNVQGAAQALHVSFEDTTASLAVLAPAFESSAQAGTALNVFMTRLVPQTDKANDKMHELGIITKDNQSLFFDTTGHFLGMSNAAQVLKEKLGGLSDEQKIDTLHLLFGNDAQKVANLLLADGAAAIDTMKQKMAAANGVANTAALVQSGYNTALDNAKGSVEALQIRIGSALLPVLTTLLNDYIAPGINSITSFAESFLKMVPAIQASDDPLQTFLNALKVAAPQFLDIISGIEDFKDAITPAINEIMRLADAFGQGGLGGLIDTLVSDIQAALPDIEAQLGAWGQAFVDWIAPMIPPLLDKLGELTSDAWSWAKDQAPGWGKQLLAWGDALVKWIAPMIPPALAELGKLGNQFMGWIGAQAAPILARLQTWATSFVAWIPGATVTFLAKWPVMFDQFLDWVGKAAGPLLKQLGDWAISFIQWIAPMIPPFLVALGGIALAIGVWVVETAAVLAGKIVNTWVPAIIGWIVTDAVPGLYKALESIWKVFQGWILDLEQDLAQKMRDVGTNIIAGIVKGVEGAAGSLMSTLKSLASDALQAAKDALGISSPSTAFMPVGKFMVEGIMAGFSAMWPQLTALVSNMSDDLIKQVADIGEQVNGMIADSFGATASIDRQIAKNLSSFKDVLPAYQASVQGMLKDAEQQARAFLDPAEGAKFFKMRSNQILEYAKLQKDLADEQQAIVDSGTAQSAEMAKSDQLRAQLAGDLTDEQRTALEAQLSITENLVEKDAIRARLAADLTDTQRESVEKQLAASQIAQDAQIAARKDAIAMIATLQQQMLLINQAQAAEISQFDANKAAQGNPMQDLIDQIQQLFNNSKKADLEKQYAEAKTDAERERIRKLIEDAAIPINDTGIGHDLQALIQLLTKIFNVQGAAGGGPVESGQPYWVGEQGPELFWPQMNGMVSPAASSAQMAARGNQTNYSTTYNNTMPIYTNNSPGALQQSWAIMQASMP